MNNVKFSGFSFKDISLYNKPVIDMSWSNDGSLLGTASSDKSFKIIQLEPMGGVKVIQNIPTVSGAGTQLKWHPEEKQKFAAAGEDTIIELWDVRAPKATTRLTSVGYNLFIAWSPNGRYLASVSKTDVLIVYDCIEGRQIKDYRSPHEINEISWTCNSDYILVASSLGGIEIMHFFDDTISRIDFILGHTSNCHQLNLYDPIEKRQGYRDVSLLALGGSDFQVTLWDVHDLICHTTIRLESEVRGINLSSDGNYLAIASEEPNILFFSTESGKQIHKADAKTPFRNIRWHPTANLLVASPDERVNPSGAAHLRLLTFNKTS